MRKKIQRSMTLVIAITMIVVYAITIIFVYGEIRALAEQDVKYETEYLAVAVDRSGESILSEVNTMEPGSRLTLIDSDGTVLYDTEENAATMPNHLQRPEVVLAIREGMGHDVRKSDTLGEDMFYCARVLKNGKILRVSKPVRTALFTALQLLPVMTIIALCLFAAAIAMSRRQAKALVDPINRLDLDDPLENDVYEELSPLLKRIDEQNKAKDALINMRKEFTANVSHELKTPLTSISGYAEIIRDGLVKEKDIPKFSDRIYKEANRLVTLINDIMKLSKLDEDKLNVEKTDVDLFEMTKEIVQRLAPRARECDVHVDLMGERCVVNGIAQLLDEMVSNIVENAIKYNKKGGKVEIWVGEDMSGKKVIVSDTGIGISPEDRERIFERFYRVDKSHSKDTGGTGLGLSIVKHGAIVHKAQIDVQGKLGEGTRMSIIFPKSEN